MNFLKKILRNPFEEANTVRVELFEDEEALVLIESMKQSGVSFIRMKDCMFDEATLEKLQERGYTAKNIIYQGKPGVILKW